MTDVPITAASDFQPSDIKFGRHIVCEIGRDARYDAPKKDEYLCTIRVTNITKGAIE